MGSNWLKATHKKKWREKNRGNESGSPELQKGGPIKSEIDRVF